MHKLCTNYAFYALIMQKLSRNYARYEKITQKLRKNHDYAKITQKLRKKNYAKIKHTCVNCIICIVAPLVCTPHFADALGAEVCRISMNGTMMLGT